MITLGTNTRAHTQTLCNLLIFFLQSFNGCRIVCVCVCVWTLHYSAHFAHSGQQSDQTPRL